MLCLAMLTAGVAYGKSDVDGKKEKFKNGYYEAVASAEQLKTLNQLYGKEITYGELIQAVYPEALDYIPEKTKQEMYQTPVEWASGEDGSKSKTNDGASLRKENSDIGALAIITIGHESNISKDSTGIDYDSGSRVWTPHPWYRIPKMSVISNLERSGGGFVASRFATGTNVYAISAAGRYSNPTNGSYRTVGQHWGEYPVGYEPPTYSNITYTSWITVP